jgi:hypothetical protein
MHRSSSDGGSSSGWSDAAAAEDRPGWELRPSGMVVQAREDAGGGAPPPGPPEIRVRVSYGAARHQVPVSPAATFGECTRLLLASVKLNPPYRRLIGCGSNLLTNVPAVSNFLSTRLRCSCFLHTKGQKRKQTFVTAFFYISFGFVFLLPLVRLTPAS